MQFEIICFIYSMNYHITLKFVNLWAWMEVKHWIYLVSNIFPYSAWCRDINYISRYKSFGNNIQHFSSSFLPSYTIRRYHICSHYFNDFRKIIQTRIKVSRVTPGHYGSPLRNINISFFAFMFEWYLGNFDNFLKFWFHISKFDEFKSRIWMTFSLTSNHSFLSQRHARASFWCY